MKKIIKSGLISTLFVFCLSCNSWLDVKPTDRASGNVLFETREGFLKALNGVYMGLTNRSIYGREMTAGMLDLMGQYYLPEGNRSRALSQYEYTNDRYNASMMDAIWSNLYNLIVCLNIIIDQCGDSNPALPGMWHGLVKGEALAMRAFFHLDILRIWGPVYKDRDPNEKFIPYVTTTDQMISPLLTAEQVGLNILQDLDDAIALLGAVDPIIKNGVMNSSELDNSLRYRQYRMNYYAAKALRARTLLWMDNKAAAYIAATELIAETSPDNVFPFVTNADATSGTRPDRVFSTEIMFAAYDNFRSQQIHDAVHNPILPADRLLRFSYPNANNANSMLWTGRISQLYTDQNDYRYRLWFGSYPTMNNTNIFFIRKYAMVDDNSAQTSRFRYMIPLVRISEMYLIAAECAPSIAAANGYMNTLRAARFCVNLPSETHEQLMNNVEWEFRREFLGEGQMFFFYKRLGKPTIPDGSRDGSQVIEMTTAKYVAPLPLVESNERPTESTDDTN